MFRLLGGFVARFWWLLLIAWAALVLTLWFAAPPWSEVGKSGEFAYLPADTPSRRAESLLHDAFPAEQAGSSVVLILTRSDGGELNSDDLHFSEQVLAPRLHDALSAAPVARIRTPGAGPEGVLLRSPDRRAALVVVELVPEFLDAGNWPNVAAVEELIAALRQEGAMPPRLDLALTGSAVLGRDIGRAEEQSARAIERWTILVVVILLLLVYRAPLLAALPLLTVFVAVEVSLRLLGLMSEAWNLNLFQGVRVYATVVGYGAGVDYCLFLIARCREEWAAGARAPAGVAAALRWVGAAVTASAATVAVGIAMMGFAEFGKLRQAGLGIAFTLVVVLLAALTFAPALLCLTGRWALWPRHRPPAPVADGEPAGFWGWLGRVLARWPLRVWLAATAVMAPFAVVAVLHFNDISYDLTANLPGDAPSVAGLRRLKEHFPAGWTGPVTVLVRDDGVDFRTPDGRAAVAELVRGLQAHRDEYQIADTRSLADPLGTTPAARAALERVAFGAAVVRQRALERYVGGAAGHVTRLDVVLDTDPFSNEALDRLPALEAAVRQALPEARRADADVLLAGPSAGMRDLATVTRRDQWRVDLFVVAAVLVVLLLLLRRPVLSAYLILSVIFSYLTTFGLTLLVFRAIEPNGFTGLDWKVPFFLFTILVAVGEDYNIFLLTRVREETKRHGPVGGVSVALGRTGGVITSCGVIMAGTFASLFAGSLAEMKQMAFALASGVLLDTFLVRPVLVPAFLLVLRRFR